MLIVAIPKSSSTSLVKTLGELHQIPTDQDFTFKDNPPAKGADYLYQLHSDIRELTETEVARFSGDGMFYKQHIFPSENNIKLLAGLKKVILLRNPMDIIWAYRRALINDMAMLLPGHSYNETKNEWLAKCKETGLHDELWEFYNRWTKETETGNAIIVDFDELIRSPKPVINRIEEFWGLPVTTKDFELARERYSREKEKSANTFFHTQKTALLKVLRLFGLEKIARKIYRGLRGS